MGITADVSDTSAVEAHTFIESFLLDIGNTDAAQDNVSGRGRGGIRPIQSGGCHRKCLSLNFSTLQ